MSDIRIKLPDGSERALKSGATSLDLAKTISEGLAKKVVVALVNGQAADLQDPLHDGDDVKLLDATAPEAKDVISPLAPAPIAGYF